MSHAKREEGGREIEREREGEGKKKGQEIDRTAFRKNMVDDCLLEN